MTDDGSFEQRLQAARIKQGLDAPAVAPAPPAGSSPAGIGLRVGIELVSALAVAVAIGWALDRWLNTTPWLLGLFVLLGGAAGVANVWRLMMPRRKAN
ncbi:MAG: AtpZ/AtpI family protein [Gemmatimonadaceae bacterium]|nr:AtpZ/AtpI family protein [Acetobacteraceae bacterium]